MKRSVWVRLASRTSTTRMSSTMASSILRSTSACALRPPGFLSGQCAGDHAQLIQLGDARHQCRDRRTECGDELLLAVGQILRHCEQQAGDARLGIEPQRGDGGGHAEPVVQHRFPGAEPLVGIHRHGKIVCAAQPGRVGFGQAGADRDEHSLGQIDVCGLHPVSMDGLYRPDQAPGRDKRKSR